MSFVIPTADKPDKSNPNPGPGEYLVDKNTQIKHAFAPFNSTQKRNEETVKEILPGPTSYNPATINDVFVKRKPKHNTFQTRIPRFKDPVSVGDTGPGKYNITEEKKDIRIVPRNNQMLSIIRNTNNLRKAPSIKNPKQFVRIVYTDPSNSQSHISKYVNVDYINRNVGPGDYNIPHDSPNRGVSWSKSKSKRFQDQRSVSVGPGQYNLPDRDPIPKQSSSFVSQSIRSHFDSIIYKTNIQDLANLRHYINYKDTAPGPGHYQKVLTESKENATYQFFGSTSERFQNFVNNGPIPGPGTYDVSSEKKDYSRRRNKTVFQAAPRMTVSSLSQKHENPGPGQYTSINKTLKQQLFQKYRRGYRGEFGSKESRFKTIDPRKMVRPGPGQYNVSQRANNRSMTSYISQSKRTENVKTETPFGSYNIEVYDLSKIMKKKREFIENLRKIEVFKPGFESAAQRFKTEATPEQPKEDPLVQELNMQFQVGKHRKGVGKTLISPQPSSNFKSKSKRFSTEVQDIPPPGYYGDEMPIEKHSYNVKYGYKRN